MKKIILTILILALSVFTLSVVRADNNKCQNVQNLSIDDIGKCLSDLGGALEASQKATAPLQSQLNNLANQLKGIEQRVSFLENDLAVKKKYIDDGYKELEKQKVIFNQTVRDYYIKNSFFSPILIFISSVDASNLTRILAYQKKGADQDKIIITNIALKLTDLENRKAKLEAEQQSLSVVKDKLAKEKVDIEKVVNGALAYQATLSSQIAALSAKQQEILNQRLAGLNIPQSAYAGLGGGCSSDLTNGKDPGFSPRFGFFTFGVPNRVGLNQYGAKGRAEAGQNYTQILNAYYQNFQITNSSNVNITVNGTNDYGQSFSNQSMPLEEYLKHVYEVPTTWPAETLKAQAIAARSYALAYTNNGQSPICTDQHCQEIKQELNSQAWVDAVNATAGQTMTSGGQPIKAWFSSTHGGYVFSSGDIGWSSTSYTKSAKDASTDSINSFDDLKNNAYDKASPWFYCDWGSRSQYGGTAWIKPEEIADIANVLLLVQRDSSTKEHLYQPDKPNPAGTDTWDPGRVKQELSNRGGTPFNSVSSVSVDWDKGAGRTTSVTISGDGGTVSFSGSDFKTYFNLRAPANIQIVGPLFNIEH